ncbi:protochlorophyllide reductase [Actinocorallia lasiicapitis]
MKDGPRSVLITGGTGGLGHRTARILAAAGLRVVITGRDPEAVRRKAAAIGEGVTGLALDLGSLADVRRFAEGLPALQAVVCNAGVQTVSGEAVSADGFEQTFAVNHLAHFLLVRELLPRLAAPARIVLVASDTHDPAKRTGMPAPVYTSALALATPGGDADASASLAGRRRYTTSKLCNVLTAYELARRIGDTGITVNAFDPGLMPGTGLARDYPAFQAFAWRYLLPAATLLPGLNVHTPGRSARALARLVTDPALAGTTGAYFSGTRRIRSSADSYDPAKAADLWETSERLIGY